MTETIQSGIYGLDEMMGGGFPKNRIILILGGPGAGKTILAAQFLYKGITEFNENGVMISLDENKDHFYAEMMNFGWDFQKAEDEGKFEFIDATRLTRVAMLKEKMMTEEAHSLRGKQLPIDKLIEQLQEKIIKIEAKRVVLDTLASLFYRFLDPIERRTAGVDLIEALSDLNTTTLVTSELAQLGLGTRKLSDEEFLVHGVLLMQTLYSGGSTVRALQVEKMRSVNVNSNVVPYTIDKNGLEVYPAMSLFRDT